MFIYSCSIFETIKYLNYYITHQFTNFFLDHVWYRTEKHQMASLPEDINIESALRNNNMGNNIEQEAAQQVNAERIQR